MVLISRYCAWPPNCVIADSIDTLVLVEGLSKIIANVFRIKRSG
jgi:hypothetical protein